MRNRGIIGAIAVLALVVTAGACSSDDDKSSDTTTTSGAGSGKAKGAPLEGTDWVLVDVAELAPGASGTVTARFADGTVAGDSACNRYRAPYEVDGDAITIGPQVASTAKACEPGLMAAEQAYQRRLVEAKRYAIRNDQLALSDGSGTTLLTYRASAGADELAGSWEVTGYFTGDAIESVRAGAELTAEFTDVDVSGNGGCNRFSGPVTTDGDEITIGPLASTLMACTDPALTDQEQRYLAALQAAKTFSVTPDRLELFREDGGIAVTFTRADVPAG